MTPVTRLKHFSTTRNIVRSRLSNVNKRPNNKHCCWTAQPIAIELLQMSHSLPDRQISWKVSTDFTKFTALVQSRSPILPKASFVYRRQLRMNGPRGNTTADIEVNVTAEVGAMNSMLPDELRTSFKRPIFDPFSRAGRFTV
jgi:hypothetical protein